MLQVITCLQEMTLRFLWRCECLSMRSLWIPPARFHFQRWYSGHGRRDHFLDDALPTDSLAFLQALCSNVCIASFIEKKTAHRSCKSSPKVLCLECYHLSFIAKVSLPFPEFWLSFPDSYVERSERHHPETQNQSLWDVVNLFLRNFFC